MILRVGHIVRRGGSIAGALCLVGVQAAGCDHRGVPLVRTVPVALAQPADVGAIEHAIESSLAQHHWTVKEHVSQRYVAQLDEHGHSATVAIVYDARGARIDYVDSND